MPEERWHILRSCCENDAKAFKEKEKNVELEKAITELNDAENG